MGRPSKTINDYENPSPKIRAKDRRQNRLCPIMAAGRSFANPGDYFFGAGLQLIEVRKPLRTTERALTVATRKR